jgi:hypothetical protein
MLCLCEFMHNRFLPLSDKLLLRKRALFEISMTAQQTLNRRSVPCMAVITK